MAGCDGCDDGVLLDIRGDRVLAAPDDGRCGGSGVLGGTRRVYCVAVDSAASYVDLLDGG